MTVMFHIDPVPTEVTFRNHQGSSVEVKSGDIWPIPVRGSKYNIQFSKDSVVYSEETGKPTVVEAQNDQIRRIGMKRLDEFSPGPEVSEESVSLIAGIRKWKNGPITITPAGEAIVFRNDSPGEAAGWNPYYVGKVNIDPIWSQYPKVKGGHPGVNGLFPTAESAEQGWFTPEQWSLWTGCMFKTGEPWTVRVRSEETGELTWPGRHKSRLERGLVVLATGQKHHELIATYKKIRPHGGRLYILMGGHIWMNAPKIQISDDEVWEEVSKNMMKVLSELTNSEDHPLTKMFNARMQATKGVGNGIDMGCLPIYLGKCSDFDNGSIPTTTVSTNYQGNYTGPEKIDGDEENPYSTKEEREMR